MKNENHALEEKLIEIQDIRNTSQNSDDEFQSAIEALQSTLQEVKYFNQNNRKYNIFTRGSKVCACDHVLESISCVTGLIYVKYDV